MFINWMQPVSILERFDRMNAEQIAEEIRKEPKKTADALCKEVPRYIRDIEKEISKKTFSGLRKAESGISGKILRAFVYAEADSSSLRKFIAACNKKALMASALCSGQKYARRLLEIDPSFFSFRTLVDACRTDQPNIVRMLLDKNPLLAKQASKKTGKQPVHWAAEYGSISCLELLGGYDAKAAGGSTPLHFAAEANEKEAAAYLLKKFPDSAHLQDERGRTPLHIALSQGSEEAACTIEPCFKRWDLADSDGRNALYAVQERPWIKMDAFYRQLFKNFPGAAELFIDGRSANLASLFTACKNPLMLLYILQEIAPPPLEFTKKEYEKCQNGLPPAGVRFIEEELCRINFSHIPLNPGNNPLLCLLQKFRAQIIDKIIEPAGIGYNRYKGFLNRTFNLGGSDDPEDAPPEQEIAEIRRIFCGNYTAAAINYYIRKYFYDNRQNIFLNKWIEEQFQSGQPNALFQENGYMKKNALKKLLIRAGVLEAKSPFVISS